MTPRSEQGPWGRLWPLAFVVAAIWLIILLTHLSDGALVVIINIVVVVLWVVGGVRGLLRQHRTEAEARAAERSPKRDDGQ